MGADFSRVRLNPLLDYAGVELKQGAALLDADANELVAILDRRLRALAGDTLGRATVSSTTPDGFKIAVAVGAMQIGKGRLYVDGLLAENHGAQSADPAKQVFDGLLGEGRFADPIDYAAQPYLPAPPPCRPPVATWSISTSGTVRSPTWSSPIWSRALSVSKRPRACRPSGRCTCCPTTPAPLPRADRPTATCPAGAL